MATATRVSAARVSIDEYLRKAYMTMGVPNTWLIDPETRTGRTCQGNAWIEVKRFEVAESPIYLNLTEQFSRLDRYENA